MFSGPQKIFKKIVDAPARKYMIGFSHLIFF